MSDIGDKPKKMNGIQTGERVPDKSQTASDYIDEQLALEADAREILPYKFDKCTYALGPLRQGVFACLTCSPAPASPAQVHVPAGICYACSISCHGDHTLVELFTRRNFTCDCGTTRFSSTSPCTLRLNATTGSKGVHSQEPSKTNAYNQNFQNKFCGCGQEYDAETEKGTMYQCLGLGTTDSGGCGEDWWHAHCLLGLPSSWPENPVLQKPKPCASEPVEGEDHPVPEQFPDDNDFTTLICYKCVEANPWIKPYAGTDGFLAPLYKTGDSPSSEKAEDGGASTSMQIQPSLKRKGSPNDEDERPMGPIKRVKEGNDMLDAERHSEIEATSKEKHKHDFLPPAPQGTFSLLAKKDFRESLCHCPRCFHNLVPYPQLQEEEDEYEPSLSDSEQSIIDGSAARSHGTGSLLERGEAALNNVDRVRAIEGVMVYNHLKDKVKEFLKPYAESGQAVGAEDIKAYFEKLRGDEAAIREAGQRPTVNEDKSEDKGGDNRKEQGGY